MQPRWLAKARKHIGQKEIHGRRHNPLILRWWTAIRAPFTDDETPWCAAFVGGVLESCGVRSSRSAAARSYSSWGVALARPAPGAIIVFWRGAPSSANGHVGFLAGEDARGNLLVLGGNQGDQVSIRPFDRARLIGCRWPDREPLPRSAPLPRLSTDAALSTHEA